MKEHLLPVKRTARYYTIGDLNLSTKTVWLVCHGYGELAANFINSFTCLNDGKTLIIAPEALNRFYLSGLRGNVGASWMTKEFREAEIKDNLRYLNEIYKLVFETIDRDSVKFNVLGFSQGTATVCRWMEKMRPKVDNLSLWGGGFPNDVNLEYSVNYFNDCNINFFIGKYDRIVDKGKVDEQSIRLKKARVRFKLNMFEGKHEVEVEEVRKLANSYL